MVSYTKLFTTFSGLVHIEKFYGDNMEHRERSNKNKKFLKYMAAGIGCLVITAAGIFGGKYYYDNYHDPLGAPNITMMAPADKDVETHTPVSHIGGTKYMGVLERESIALPTIDPTEPEVPEVPVDAPISYPLDRSVPYEEGWKTAGATLDGLTGYQAKYPGLYAAKKDIVDPAEKTIYLTFDDGPSANTDIVLDELDKYGVKATFFVYPGSKNLDSVKSRLLEIANRGHAIAIHTWCHDYKAIYQSVDTFLADMDKVARLIYETTGIRPCAYRFPGGSNNGRAKNVNRAILDEMERRGFVCFDWNSSTQDAENKPFTASQLADNAIKSYGNKQRVIVLAHDGGGQKKTPYAVGKMVQEATNRGFKFAVLDNSCREMLFVKR